MLESVANLTNITSLTSVSKGFIDTMLHSQEFWVALIVGVVLLVGGIMIRWLFQRKQHAHDLKMLKLQQEQPKQEAKRILGRGLEEFHSCWTDFKEKHIKSKYINLDFRNELFVCGNRLKKAIEEDEGLLPKTIVDEANNIADTFIDLANSLRLRIDRTGMATDAQKQQKYQEVLAEGDRIVKEAKELKEKLGADGNE